MASIHTQTMTDIDGTPVSLEQYRGKVALVVNLASRCGYTPQYKDLEALWRRYRDQGVVVLGFPSNDFGAQEPGSESQIKEFCSRTYDVTFPLFSKVKVKGADKAPLYALLSEQAGAPQWNFHKYLVGKDGQVIRGFTSDVEPLSSELTGAIEQALKA